MQESVAALRSYDEFGMYSLSGTHEGPASYSMGMGMPSMSMGRAGKGYRRMRSSAPDLPSLLLDSRIIFLGMPVRDQPSVLFLMCNTEFIRFQLAKW